MVFYRSIYSSSCTFKLRRSSHTTTFFKGRSTITKFTSSESFVARSNTSISSPTNKPYVCCSFSFTHYREHVNNGHLFQKFVRSVLNTFTGVRSSHHSFHPEHRTYVVALVIPSLPLLPRGYIFIVVGHSHHLRAAQPAQRRESDQTPLYQQLIHLCRPRKIYSPRLPHAHNSRALTQRNHVVPVMFTDKRFGIFPNISLICSSVIGVCVPNAARHQ